MVKSVNVLFMGTNQFAQEVLSSLLTLLSKNLKLPKLTTKVIHCQNRTSDYCLECYEYKIKICNKKLTYQSIKQVNNKRRHLILVRN